MALGVHSEVGKLRKVMVHRPGLEHTRLTPSNAEELLFDDVLWVRAGQARARHVLRGDARPRRRGVRGRDAARRGAREARGQGLGRASTSSTSARSASARPSGRGEWVGERRPPRRSPTSSSAASPAATSSRTSGWCGSRPTRHAMLLPPLPNFLFQRDPSCWIFDGVTINPMTKPAREAGDDDHRGDLPVPPDVHRRAVPDLAGRRRRGLGPLPRRGRRRAADRQRHRHDRHGRAHDAAGRALVSPARCSGPARPTQVLAVHLPKSRSYMHLDTVITMCDRDLVTLFPQVVYGARTWAIRPGDTPDDLVVEEQDGHAARAHGARRSASPRCASSRPAATRSRPSASSGTTATTSSPSNPASSSPTSATSAPTPRCARPASRSSRSRASSSAAAAAAATA